MTMVSRAPASGTMTHRATPPKPTRNAPTVASATTLKVVGGARNSFWLGEPITIGEPGAILYSGVIDGIPASDSQVLTVSPALPATPIAAGTLVTFPRGGAALNLADYQKVVFGSTRVGSARSGDSTNIYPAFYGNVHGSFVMESGNDGSGNYVSLRAPKMVIGSTVSGASVPDFARFRLRQNGSMQFYAPNGISVTGALSGTDDITIPAGKKFVMGSGVWIFYNLGGIYVTKDGGSTYALIH